MLEFIHPNGIRVTVSGKRGDAFLAQHVRAKILTVFPLYASQEWPDGMEEAFVAQLPKNPAIQIRLHVKRFHFPIAKSQREGVIGIGLDGRDAGVYEVYSSSIYDQSR